MSVSSMAGAFGSDDLASDPRSRDFGDDDDREDDQKNQPGLVPIQIGESGIEGHAEAAAADEAENGGLAHIDVPAKNRDREERRLYLRPVALQENGQRRGARRRECLDRTAARLLDGFGEEFSGEAD